MRITHRFTKAIANSQILWKAFRPFVKVANGINYYRTKKLEEPAVREVEAVFKEPVVLHGPFKGLKYPDYGSFGSAIYPKILGSYEAEIIPFWKIIIESDYEKLIDVGSAEGYYSIGLAMKSKSKGRVVAVDISKTALGMVTKIAQLNGVADRIDTVLGMDAVGLEEACSGKRNFILCDCEGFEKELFTSNNISSLANCDVLIEVHDAKVHRVSKYLDNLFSETHTVSRVYSTDDMYKLNFYDYPELAGLSDAAIVKMLSEGRSNIQEWIFCQPKTNSSI